MAELDCAECGDGIDDLNDGVVAERVVAGNVRKLESTQRLMINPMEGRGRYSFPTPQTDDRAAHMAQFTPAFYT